MRRYLCPIAIVLVAAAVLPAAAAASQPADATSPAPTDAPALVRAAAADSRLAWMLTEPQDLKDLLGPPVRETTRKDGDMQILTLEYPQVHAFFAKMRNGTAPFTLRRLAVGSKPPDEGRIVDIGQGRLLTLKKVDDLRKFDSFWGFANVSLAELDLRGHQQLLRSMPFDTRTLWPPAERLPAGFDPDRMLEMGKNPGLGLRGLHRQGIDGRGVCLAIIDQPLIPDHREFADRVAQYKEVGVSGVEPQMHGPPIASIAVGRTCGVAPRATLFYYAVPMWKRDNRPYCDIINEIIQRNRQVEPSERIRVVSISTAMFSHQDNFPAFQQACRDAASNGLLILTCAQDELKYCTVGRNPDADPDDPHNYRPGKYGVRPGALLVPAGNRTTASHQGPDVYAYWTEGGLSWATPYLAGLAALAFQVEPDITPQGVIELLRRTAVKVDAGPVVNPPAFIEALRRDADDGA